MVTALAVLLIFLLVLAGAGVMWGLSTHHAFLAGRNGCRNAFAQIDVQLQRRHDLIPSLIETARGCMTHERETLDAVVCARDAAMSGLAAARATPGDVQAMAQLGAAEGQLGGALGRLMTVAESYPDLQANPTMLRLSEELASTETQIALARQAYNAAVASYNNRREVFPASLLAGGFAAAALLEIAQPEKRETMKAMLA